MKEEKIGDRLIIHPSYTLENDDCKKFLAKTLQCVTTLSNKYKI